MATDCSRLSPNHSDAQLGWICSGLALFTLIAGLIAALAVFANDLYFWRQSPLYISPYLFGLAFVLGTSHRVLGLMLVIAILPLSAGLGQQFNAYLGTSLITLPNQGLDLASGFFLGAIASYLVKAAIHRKTSQSILSELQCAVPWPIALVMVMVTCSTVLAIARNIYQSATATSVKGVLFNLVHFRPIDWHADFMPISDWVAYALAVSMVGVVIGYLINQPNRIQIIFRPLIVGLLIAVGLAIAQAMTGIGLPEHLLTFRKDFFGYATIGFQPDLHAFAGHMLLGAIGLIGYLKTLSKPSTERTIVQVTIALCWFGLVLSKSRALLLLAIVTVAILVLYSIWKNNKRLFPKILITGIAVLILFGWLVGHYSNNFNGIPVLAWLGELANEFKSRDLTSWSLFSGIFGSRFEIWEAAIRMWWEFPLLGTGQGTFYRYSAIPSFSKSHFLILNNGENAHNYLLQTLTETGIIGSIIFLNMVTKPIRKNENIKESQYLLTSFLLANIFAHSLLNRENLIIFSSIIGLLYAGSMDVNTKKNCIKSIFKYRLALICIIIVTLIAYEIKISFTKIPFIHGLKCYKEQKKYLDKWNNGILIFKTFNDIISLTISYPITTKNLKIFELDPRSKIQRELKYLILIKNNQSETIKISINEPNYKSENNNKMIEIMLLLETCYTARNIGNSTDFRVIGFRVDEIK